MKHLLMLAVAGTMLLTACSDDSTTNPNPTTDVYIPSKTGAYIIHANNETTDGVTTDVSDDSTVVIGTVAIKDDANVTKTAVRHEVYVEDEVIDTLDIAQEGSKIYLNFPLELGNIGGVEGDSYGTRWVMIGDINGSTWTGLKFDTTIKLPIEGLPEPIDATMKFNITGKKVGTENLTIDGKTVSCVKFQNTFTVNVTALGFTIPIVLTQDVWLGKGVGLVKQAQAESLVDVPSELSFFVEDFTIPGFESVAIRYGGQ